MDRGIYTFKKIDVLIFSFILLYSIVVIVGFLSGLFSSKKYFENQIGEHVTLEGTIDDDPNVKEYGLQFVLDAKNNVIVSTKNTAVSYGDTVSVAGTLDKPANFETTQGNTFDYVSYLAKDDIYYSIKNASTTVISHGGSWFYKKLIAFKHSILKGYSNILPSGEADLLGGINLGAKQNISNDFRNALVTTGTIHIIALSGYNVTIVSNALRDFLIEILSVSSRLASLFGGIGIVLFIALTGFQSSAIRAGIMSIIGIFSREHGRQYDAFRALVIAGFIMIIWNPKYLVYDVSFQLSFLATLGIIFLTPMMERFFTLKWKIPQKFLFLPLREMISVTLGAQLAVAPFILYKMGTFSFIALPANILVLPLMPFIMFFGAVAGFLGMLSKFLAYPFTLVTHLSLKYIIYIINLFAKIPYASVAFTGFSLWVCIVLYIILIYFIWKNFSLRQTN